jgi:hypothetical protein
MEYGRIALSKEGVFGGRSDSPGNADLSDEAAGVSNDGAKSENADIAASAGNGKRRAPKRFPISSNQRDAI